MGKKKSESMAADWKSLFSGFFASLIALLLSYLVGVAIILAFPRQCSQAIYACAYENIAGH